MAAINLSGLSTGIDTNSIIQQLIAVEGKTRDMYQLRVTAQQKKQDSLNTLKTNLTALQTAVNALSNADALKAFNISSGDDTKVTADASNDAFEGNHTVVINQLATADRWVQKTGLKNTEDYVGAGTFIYSYDGKETSVTTTSTTTLEELVGLINNDSNNPGVSATLLYYNNAYHMVLNGKDAGSDYAIKVNSNSTEVWQAGSLLTVNGDNADTTTLLTNLDSPEFTGTTFNGNETLIISGIDHNGNSVSPFTVNLTDNTKISHVLDSIEQAFDGNVKATLDNGKIVVTDKFSGTSQLSISMAYNANGSSATLALPGMAVSSEGGATTASLAGFATSDFIRSQVAQDSKIKVDGFPSDSAVSEVQQIAHPTAIDSGTFTLSYGGYTTSSIDYNASIADIQAAINALPSVQAGDITVSGDTLDGTGNLTFTFKNTLGDVSSMLIDSSGLSSPLTVTEQTKGVDEWIGRSSNTIDNVISGITLYLHDVTSSAGQQITLTRDVASVQKKLGDLVSAYNTVASYIKDNTGYNTQTKTAGVLMGDYTVTTVNDQLYTTLVNSAKGFLSNVDSFLMPGQIGLQLDKDGVLSLDTNTFNDAVSKNYMGVLALIGADKTGSTDSSTIKFNSASSKYTAAGEYNVRVTVSGGHITSAQIKTASDSTWRNATYADNIILGNGSFDSNGNPVYPENGLQFGVDLSHDGTFDTTVDVKQGFVGALKDGLAKTLASSTGSMAIDQSSIDETIKNLQDRITVENDRLDRRQQQLVGRFARLEQQLTLIKSQLSMLTGSG
jgi:flagellar hook-associated protein 2